MRKMRWMGSIWPTISDETRAELAELLERDRQAFRSASLVTVASTGQTATKSARSDIPEAPVYVPADLKRHVLKNYPLTHIRPYLNLQMLLGKHLGLRGNVEKRLAERDEQALELLALIESLIAQGQKEGWLQAHAVYQFFPAIASGNTVRIFNPEAPDVVLEEFHFPRQARPRTCAWQTSSGSKPEKDYVGFFAVTAGRGIREVAERRKADGDYLRAHALQALALELAEAFAERLHHILRDSWGFPDSPEMTMRERFIARYQGIRVSFGYPACPEPGRPGATVPPAVSR